MLWTVDQSQRIIEIGAGYNPIAPKSKGWQTHVVDHASRNDLQVKYSTAGVDTQMIEEVDTIWRSGPLHESVPPALLGKIDSIIASHVLEHIPDLIGFFQSASRLVAPGGSLRLALPDRRYCFDCFKPWTTTGDLLDAQYRGLTRHSLKTAFDHVAYSAAVDGKPAWGPHAISVPVLTSPFQLAAQTVTSFRDSVDQPYQDYHCWQFSPAGFELAILELGELQLTDWRVEKLEGPENFEFFAVLRKGGASLFDQEGLQVERRRLLVLQLKEAREQIDFIIGTGKRAPAPTDDRYQELADALAEQNNRLRDMAETLAWLRAVLSPIRRVWRTLRGLR